MLQHQENDDFLDCVVFSDESTFHLNGNVFTHNVRIWGSENPREFVQSEGDATKLNVFCALSWRKVYGSFLFVEANITGMTYLDMLQEWLFHQLQDQLNFIWQQDGAPPHWHNLLRDWLNDIITDLWIGRHGPDDRIYLQWPHRSPDCTPCDFFLWGFVKDKVYMPPLTANLPELRAGFEKLLLPSLQACLLMYGKN